MTNRRRDVLHVSKVHEFLAWAKSQGWETEETRSVYELFRLRKPYSPLTTLMIAYKRNRSDHATTTGNLTKLVDRWQRTLKSTTPDA